MLQQSKDVTPGNPIQTDAVKRVLYGKPKQGNQFCKLCKKKGHRASGITINQGVKMQIKIHLKLTFLLSAIDVARKVI